MIPSPYKAYCILGGPKSQGAFKCLGNPHNGIPYRFPQVKGLLRLLFREKEKTEKKDNLSLP